MEFLSIYWLYIKTFFKARAEYRFGLFCALFANFYSYLITYLTCYILISSLKSIGGWDFPDLSILFALNLLASSVSAALIWYTVFNLSSMITSGKLDGLLIKPVGVMKQLIFQRFGDTALAQILTSIIFLILAIYIKVDEFSVLKIVYLIFCIIGGVLIHCGFMILVGSVSFWTFRSSEIGKMVYYDIRSLIQFPLQIYPKWIKFTLTFIFPWAFVNYYPSLILLNKVKNIGEFILGIIAPIIGLLFFMFSLFVFNKGLNKYTGVGN